LLWPQFWGGAPPDRGTGRRRRPPDRRRRKSSWRGRHPGSRCTRGITRCTDRQILCRIWS